MPKVPTPAPVARGVSSPAPRAGGGWTLRVDGGRVAVVHAGAMLPGGGVLDELAFFRLEGAADSDVEIQASIRRGMLAFASTRLVKISTPYMQGGVLYDDFVRAYGQDAPDLLVWRAPSTVMNPNPF